MFLLYREAMVQRPSREILQRKSSTAITEPTEVDDIDFGVRPISALV